METHGNHGAADAQKPVQKATVNGLAIVGFIALILVGMFLAIYAAGYVPDALSRLAGAVYLAPGEVNEPETPAAEEETPAETPSETPEPTTPVVTPTTPVVPATTTPPSPKPTTPTVPRYITTTVPVPVYGLPDLAITSLTTGYMRGSTFIRSDEVPSNRDAVIKFTVKNIGTNVVSDWRVRVEVEDERDSIGVGSMLRPEGYQTFTLFISNHEEDRDLVIDIDVDYQNRINESNERNNDRSTEIEIN